METIIPLLIAAVVFGLQAYANFQKEQEKARKRNPGRRPPSGSPDSPLPNAEAGMEDPYPSTYGDEKPIKTSDTHREVSPRMGHPFDRPQPVSSAFEEYTGTVHVRDTKRIKRTHRQTPDRLQVAEDEVFSEPEALGYDFDLRDAVIKAAILERPYK